jgi:hypothetical protein
MKTKGCALLALFIVSTASLLLPSPALAGDAMVDDTTLPDIPADAKAYFDRCEAQFQKWLASKPEIVPMMIDAPYKTLVTTSHKQIRNDYCGPATMAIIDHFLRGSTKHWSQNEWAAFKYNGSPLWTDADGAFMWVMAMGLKEQTGKTYTYTSGNTMTQVYDRTRYGIDRGRPVAYGLRIYQDDWPYYNFYHAGHIVCGRGYDWRIGNIQLDDPYPENEYQTGGGDTYGFKTYAKSVVAGGVTASTNKQVIY